MLLACHESACAYELILVVISLGGKLASLGGSFLPAPLVDETLQCVRISKGVLDTAIMLNNYYPHIYFVYHYAQVMPA